MKLFKLAAIGIICAAAGCATQNQSSTNVAAAPEPESEMTETAAAPEEETVVEEEGAAEEQKMAEADGDRIVCRMQAKTGTRFKKRVCATVDQWTRQAEQTKRTGDQIDKMRRSQTACTGAACRP
ncbi:hypothetical protein [Hyphococcus sp.]|uniref:hypothetical protein n=1 Tax=Hyphococcus sp. TaxID=2038636 RepID=UPI003CCC0BFE